MTTTLEMIGCRCSPVCLCCKLMYATPANVRLFEACTAQLKDSRGSKALACTLLDKLLTRRLVVHNITGFV